MKLIKNKKYLQLKFSWKVFVPESSTDLTLMDSKNYVPFTCKFPMVMHFVLILRKRCRSKTIFFYVFSYDKTNLKFCESVRFCQAVFVEKLPKIRYLNYVRRRIDVYTIFKSSVMNNIDNMRISGTEHFVSDPSPNQFLEQFKQVPKQGEAKRDYRINRNTWVGLLPALIIMMNYSVKIYGVMEMAYMSASSLTFGKSFAGCSLHPSERRIRSFKRTVKRVVFVHLFVYDQSCRMQRSICTVCTSMCRHIWLLCPVLETCQSYRFDWQNFIRTGKSLSLFLCNSISMYKGKWPTCLKFLISLSVQKSTLIEYEEQECLWGLTRLVCNTVRRLILPNFTFLLLISNNWVQIYHLLTTCFSQLWRLSMYCANGGFHVQISI